MERTFEEYLKNLIELSGKSLNQVAREARMSVGYLSLVARGINKPSPEILRRLSKPLGVPYRSLMIRSGYLEELHFKTEVDAINFLNELLAFFTKKYFDEIEKQPASFELAQKYEAIHALLSVVDEIIADTQPNLASRPPEAILSPRRTASRVLHAMMALGKPFTRELIEVFLVALTEEDWENIKKRSSKGFELKKPLKPK